MPNRRPNRHANDGRLAAAAGASTWRRRQLGCDVVRPGKLRRARRRARRSLPPRSPLVGVATTHWRMHRVQRRARPPTCLDRPPDGRPLTLYNVHTTHSPGACCCFIYKQARAGVTPSRLLSFMEAVLAAQHANVSSSRGAGRPVRHSRPIYDLVEARNCCCCFSLPVGLLLLGAADLTRLVSQSVLPSPSHGA